ncbi:MAG: hypothetical protein P9X24_08870 [Candidatus Hatepunaea meridiana]|nr:hypothetical protein [Candidatus Hatepunaea meridiana]
MKIIGNIMAIFKPANYIDTLVNNYINRYNPIRIITISLFSVALISIINYQVFVSYIKAIIKDEFLYSFYLLLNITVDYFSTIETNSILRIAKKVRLQYIPLLLIIDISLSTLIFIIIPISTGSYYIFDSIVFKGIRPWIGILFWSSFSSSILLYCLISALIVSSITFPLIKMTSKLNIIDEPIYSIGMSLMFIATIIYALFIIL